MGRRHYGEVSSDRPGGGFYRHLRPPRLHLYAWHFVMRSAPVGPISCAELAFRPGARLVQEVPVGQVGRYVFLLDLDLHYDRDTLVRRPVHLTGIVANRNEILLVLALVFGGRGRPCRRSHRHGKECETTATNETKRFNPLPPSVGRDP